MRGGGERHEPEEQARQQAHRGREREDHAVNGDRVEARQVGGRERPKPGDTRVRQRDAGEPAQAGEGDAFGQHGARELRASRAECHTHRGFAPARDRARELEVGDVGARDQEYQRHGAAQHDQGLAHLANDLILEWHRAEREATVGRIDFGMIAPQTPGECVEFGLGSLERHAGTETRQDVVVLGGANIGCRRRERQWQEHVAVLHDAKRGEHRSRQGEVGGKHTHDLVGLAVQDERSADHRRIAAEPAHPGGMREHRGPGPTRYVVLRHEESSQSRTSAKHRQEVRRHTKRTHSLRFAAPGERRVGADRDRDIAERVLSLADIEVLRGGEPVFGNAEAWGSIPEDGEAPGLQVGQRAEQESGADGEQRGVRADAERQ